MCDISIQILLNSKQFFIPEFMYIVVIKHNINNVFKII